MAQGNASRISRIWERTGLRGRTLWDFLQLLIVPLLLAVVAHQLNIAADERQRLEATERYQEAILSEFLDAITGMLLTHGLEQAQHTDPVKPVARARTLTALREIDGRRKRALVAFLKEAKLITGFRPVIYLQDADLRGIDLSGMYLWGSNLGGTDLRASNLSGATLSTAILGGADLQDADLENAQLCNAFLRYARLINANLAGANLIDADLGRTNLTGARLDAALYSKKTIFPQGFIVDNHAMHAIMPSSDLRGVQLRKAFLRDVQLANADLRHADLGGCQLQRADLSGADLRGANLSGAHLNAAKLNHAKLEGAILCGTTMPDESISNQGCDLPQDLPK